MHVQTVLRFAGHEKVTFLGTDTEHVAALNHRQNAWLQVSQVCFIDRQVLTTWFPYYDTGHMHTGFSDAATS